MNKAIQRVLKQMIERYRCGDHLVVLLDYDGALTEFASRPWQATLPAVTRCQLDSLAELPRVTVGVIGGRELCVLEGMVGLPELYYAGSDGLELDYHGRTVRHPLAEQGRQLVTEVAGELERVLRDFPAAWLERKRFGLAVHYRELDRTLTAVLRNRVGEELAPWRSRLHVLIGEQVIEIVPALGWTRGTAVEFVIERLLPERALALFVGDEANDHEAMWSTRVRGGISIGVGRTQPTVAQFELRDTGEVLDLLHELCLGVKAAILPAGGLAQ
ncbi:MAG TPA: trehalose-phosphatase [Planctomycetaceae bacterium]|nr:trehalose-phosphatase [Planctomycetaceae bacterium]